MNHRSHLIGIHILGLVLVFGIKAFGQTSQELSCKAQAKEIALQTYQSCVTEARKEQIDTLRKEYSEKLAELKEHYNKELKKAAGKDSSREAKDGTEESTSEEGTIQLKPAKKAAKTTMNTKSHRKGLAKVLPKKASKASPALPVSTVTEDVKVVPSEDSIETAASQIETESQSAE